MWNREEVLSIVSRNGLAIEFCPQFQTDREVVKAVIKQNPTYLRLTGLTDDVELQWLARGYYLNGEHYRFIRSIAIFDIRFNF